MTSASNQSANDNPKPNETTEESPQPSQRDDATENRDTSTSCPSPSQPFPTKLFLVNRVTYFGFAISLSAPIVNFFLTKDELEFGVTMSLMLWIMFGILWCAAFAWLMGPVFSLVAAVIRMLDVVPSLGSSLCVLLSVWLTVEVITDTGFKGFPAFINNLPLFSLIMANAIAFALNSELEVVSGRPNRVRRSEDNSWLIGAILHSFQDGKHDLSFDRGCANAKSVAAIPFLGASGDFLTAYQNIRNNSLTYLRGENLDEFSSNFETWRTEARRIRRVLFLRRLLCLVGYIIECVALYFSFVFLNQLGKPVHTDKNSKKPASIPIELLLPMWQIVFVIVLSFLSHYLWVFVNVDSTCTSRAEVSSLVLWKMESWINWFGFGIRFPGNGKRESILPRWRKFGELLAAELPTVGIVADDNAVETGTKILLNKATGCKFTVRRIASDAIRVQHVREDVEEREMMYSESVEIAETDKVI